MSDENPSDRTVQPGVPFWAIGMVSDLAAIKQATREAANSISALEHGLDELREKSVPISEHRRLMEQMGKLWDQSTEMASQWKDRVPRIDTLWEERSEMRGSLRVLKIGLGALGTLQALVGIALALYVLGVRVHVGA